jgi:hypothetical protein
LKRFLREAQHLSGTPKCLRKPLEHKATTDIINAATTADLISLLAATRQSFLRKLAQILSPLAIRRRWLGQH